MGSPPPRSSTTCPTIRICCRPSSGSTTISRRNSRRSIGFIEFWKAKLDGPLHSVSYTHKRLIAPNEWRNVNGEFVLH